jgi:secreted Zn-dependent insulinase-like peptidase
MFMTSTPSYWNFMGNIYSSSQMQLVVLGQEGIENLTSYVANIFSPIQNKHIHAPSFPLYPYPPGYMGKQV